MTISTNATAILMSVKMVHAIINLDLSNAFVMMVLSKKMENVKILMSVLISNAITVTDMQLAPIPSVGLNASVMLDMKVMASNVPTSTSVMMRAVVP